MSYLYYLIYIYYNIFKLYLDTKIYRDMLMLCRYVCYACLGRILP